MREENVRQILQIVNGKLPEEKVIALKSKLETASDDKVDAIMCASLYNPTHVLLF